MAFDKRVQESKNSGFTFRGQPITLSKTLGRPLEGGWKRAMTRGVYPEKVKIEVVTLYAVTGNTQKVSELTKVPEATIKSWRRQEWFRDLLTEIREENNEKIDAKFTEIVEKSLDLITERLQNGDYVINPKTGELYRKPVNIRDLSIVSAINIDKRQLLRGLPTSRTEAVGSSNKLEKLAEAFIQLAGIKRDTGHIIDITPEEGSKIDNQEDQRRLQSSVGEIGAESGVEQDLSGSQEETGTSRIFQANSKELAQAQGEVNANEPLSQERDAQREVSETRNETAVGRE